MDPSLMDVGISIVIVLMLLDKILPYLTKKNGSNSKIMTKIERQVDELWEWHNIKDADGVPIWYVRRSLEDAIHKLADNIGAQTDILRSMIETQRDFARLIAEIKDKDG